MRNYNNSVVNPTGQAVAGAQIVVTKAATPPGSGAPANVFSDDGITAISNTVVADNLGRFAFFAPDGKYDLTVSGGTPLVSVPYTLAAVEIIDLLEFNALDQQPIAAQILNFTQVTSGATPPVGTTNLYAKSTDRNLYYKDAFGVETGPLGQGGGSVSSNVALKPMKSDNIQYVSQNGNDTNDGLSIGTAKLTVYAALQALPGGSSTTAGNGTVLLSGTPNYGGPVTGQGMWIMGGNDPNFASPPAGWLKTSPSPTGGFSLTVDCFSLYTIAANGHTGHCGMNAGNTLSQFPAVWISAVGGAVTVNNIGFLGGIGNYIRYGIDSNNNRNGSGGSEGFAMRNVSAANGNCTNPGQTGPVIDIGSNTFWIWLKELNLGGCQGKIFTVAPSGAVRSSNLTTITTTAPHDISTNEVITIANVADDSFNGSFGGPPGPGNNNVGGSVVTVLDSTHFTYTNPGPNTTSGGGQIITARAAAINMDSGNTGTGTGLIFIEDTNLNGGNIRYRQGQNGGGFYVRNLSYEGQGNPTSGPPDAPVVLITGVSSTSNGDGTNIKVENLEISDADNPIPGVQVDNSDPNHPDLVLVNRVAGYLRGGMTVMGNASVTLGNRNATYLRQHQFGMRNGKITTTGIDVARRGFSPVTVRATNLASINPSSWTFINGSGTITPGIIAPDGTSNAGRVAYISGIPQAETQFYFSNTALNIGDTYVFGVWTRSTTLNGYAGNQFPIGFVFSAFGFGNGDTCTAAPGNASGQAIILGDYTGSQLSDGQWHWYSGICKVASNPSTPGTAFFGLTDSTHTTEFYAPSLALYPAGAISDNEAYEIALNMNSWPSAAGVGEVSMLPSQLFRPGSTTFANLSTPNNGVMIYCSDCTITSPCGGAGLGAFAKRLGGQWVCN